MQCQRKVLKAVSAGMFKTWHHTGCLAPHPGLSQNCHLLNVWTPVVTWSITQFVGWLTNTCSVCCDAKILLNTWQPLQQQAPWLTSGIYPQLCQSASCINRTTIVFGCDSSRYPDTVCIKCCIEFGGHKYKCFPHNHQPKNVVLREMHIIRVWVLKTQRCSADTYYCENVILWKCSAGYTKCI